MSEYNGQVTRRMKCAWCGKAIRVYVEFDPTPACDDCHPTRGLFDEHTRTRMRSDVLGSALMSMPHRNNPVPAFVAHDTMTMEQWHRARETDRFRG